MGKTPTKAQITYAAPLLVTSEPRSTPPPAKSSGKRKADDNSPSSISDQSPKTKTARGTGAMSSQTKEQLVDHMLRLAYAVMEKDRLAEQLGITKKQLDNAVCLGRVNLRSKLIKAAREL